MGKTWRGRNKKSFKHGGHGGARERGDYEDRWDAGGRRGKHDAPRRNFRVSDIRDYDDAPYEGGR